MSFERTSYFWNVLDMFGRSLDCELGIFWIHGGKQLLAASTFLVKLCDTASNPPFRYECVDKQARCRHVTSWNIYHHSSPFHTISVPGFPGSLSLRRRSLPFRHFRASPCSADDSSILQATKGGRGGLANTCLPKINCRLPIIRMNQIVLQGQ